VTTKSAEQAPAPPFTTGISALLGACGLGIGLPAKVEIDTTTKLVSKTTSQFLCEVCMRTPLEPRLLFKSRRGFQSLSKVYRNPESTGCWILALIPGQRIQLNVSRDCFMVFAPNLVKEITAAHDAGEKVLERAAIPSGQRSLL
jgi:hypothetical protein